MKVELMYELFKKVSAKYMINQTMEEMAELTQALSKLYRFMDGDKINVEQTFENIYEEMADVYLMLEIMKFYVHANEEDLNDRANAKLERFLERKNIKK